MATALALFFLPPPAGIDVRVMRAAALAVFTIGFFATAVIPEFVAALSFFLLAMLFGVAPAGVVFSGFTSKALWLVIGGLILGIAVRSTGMGARLAGGMARWLPNSYVGVIAGVVLIGTTFAFVMPSSLGRVVLLAPIVVLLADRLGFTAGSNGRNAVVLAMALGTWMPSNAILPANVPNMILAGTAETLFGLSLTYGRYLLLHFPVTGVLKAVLIVIVLVVLFPDRPRSHQEDAAAMEPASRQSHLLVFALLVSLALWATDFLHGISPAWVSLGAAVFCLLPPTGLVSPADFNREFNVVSVIYVAGILGLGAMIANSGLGTLLGHALIPLLPLEPGADFRNFLTLAGFSTVAGLGVTVAGEPAILGPLSADLAQAAGLPLRTVVMIHVIGFSTVILPYQVAPIVVAMQIGKVRLGPASRATLVLMALTLLVLTPINYLWWRYLGYFGS